jgi:hypothetical protein
MTQIRASFKAVRFAVSTAAISCAAQSWAAAARRPRASRRATELPERRGMVTPGYGRHCDKLTVVGTDQFFGRNYQERLLDSA